MKKLEEVVAVKGIHYNIDYNGHFVALKSGNYRVENNFKDIYYTEIQEKTIQITESQFDEAARNVSDEAILATKLNRLKKELGF